MPHLGQMVVEDLTNFVLDVKIIQNLSKKLFGSSQANNVENIIDHFGMKDCRAVEALIDENHKPSGRTCPNL